MKFKPLVTAYCFCLFILFLNFTASPNCANAELRAGAAIIDVTPLQFPVLVNGGMLSNSASKANTPLNARAIVLDDGRERLGIMVVDSCMISREFLDEAKQLTAQRTSIQPDRMLISTTHTHTAPASLAVLGTDAETTYLPFLREKIAEAFATAEKNLAPAKIGWGVCDAASFTAIRRWIRRPDRVGKDPFGNLTVRANMHAGANWDDVTGESGPEDPTLSFIAFQSLQGHPIAILANFSMHYFSGESELSADYFGRFSDGLQEQLQSRATKPAPPFVGIMSHGCSGDIWRRDYTVAAKDRKPDPTIQEYANSLVELVVKAYDSIVFHEDADLAMEEARFKLKYRVPNQQRLEWAQNILGEMGDRAPANQTEVYAREQIFLDALQSTIVVVQALRIGDVAIATTPCETYALTGLKIKLQSPLKNTMVIELANGGDGYIPPPEQHRLGGYNTWEARSAGLEIAAEPRITEAALGLLEKISARRRETYRQSLGTSVKQLLAQAPIAYWRLDEFSAPVARDASGHQNHGHYESGVAFFLEGPHSEYFCTKDETNRAAHFAGGRLRAQLSDVSNEYSVSLWFWNGMPDNARPITGWLISRGDNHALDAWGEHLGIGGTENAPGRLLFQQNTKQSTETVHGHTHLQRWTWNHILLVRSEQSVMVFLNKQTTPEISIGLPQDSNFPSDQWFFGGRCDNQDNFAGRLDEIAVFDRVLSNRERK